MTKLHVSLSNQIQFVYTFFFHHVVFTHIFLYIFFLLVILLFLCFFYFLTSFSLLRFMFFSLIFRVFLLLIYLFKFLFFKSYRIFFFFSSTSCQVFLLFLQIFLPHFQSDTYSNRKITLLVAQNASTYIFMVLFLPSDDSFLLLLLLIDYSCLHRQYWFYIYLICSLSILVSSKLHFCTTFVCVCVIILPFHNS